MNDERYADMLDLPHHVSASHPHMSMHERAAQFSPFAALTGFADVLDEAARTTEAQVMPADDKAEALDRTLQQLINSDYTKFSVRVKFFVPDTRKAGGEYRSYSGKLRKIDTDRACLVCVDDQVIRFEDIMELTKLGVRS